MPGRARVSVRDLALAFAAVTGAWAAGVTQPLLDLYGKNATLFSAAKLDPARTVGFALIVAFAAPLAWLAIAVAIHRLALPFRVWRSLPIGAGAASALLVVANQHGVSGRIELVATLVVTLGIAVLFDRSERLRSVVALMGLLAPLSLALFLGTSSVAHITWSSAGADVAIPADQLAHRPTVVWLVIDETNLAMLLDASGEIDRQRYPNLAELAGTSTWYRNAVGIDSFTPRAVPGLLSSRDGSGNAWPTSVDYPVNAFSLLASAYRLDAFEPVTDLCVARSCLPNVLTGARSLRSFMRDAAVVFGTMVLPPRLAHRLPPVSDAWGGFGTASAPPDGQNSRTTVGRNALAKMSALDHGPESQDAEADEFIARIVRGEPPTLHFLHVLLPHRPWQLTPDETTYDTSDPGAADLFDAPSDLWLAQDEAARFALQAGAFDAVLGRLVARLRAQGLWDSTFLAISADHGITFSPGQHARLPAKDGTLDELYRVPMIIHLPGQTAGVLSDVPASTADILPTLLGALGAPPLRSSAGLDLTRAIPLDRPRTVWSVGVGHAFPAGTETVTSRLAEYSSWFPGAAAGWSRVFGRGPYAELLGQAVPVPSDDAAPFRLVPVSPRSDRRTAAASVTLVVARVAAPSATVIADGSIIVASGGTVVGFLGGAGAAATSDARVEGVVDWRVAGASDGLTYYLATGPASSPTLRRIAL